MKIDTEMVFAMNKMPTIKRRLEGRTILREEVTIWYTPAFPFSL